MAFDFPGSPSTGQTYTSNGITYTYDGTVWKRNTAAAKGQKGEVGAGGSGGDKGQKGEVGATGSGGSTGSTGDKGEKGQKGQIGADGGSGADGSDGSKGQKGEAGAGQTPAIVATQRTGDASITSHTSLTDVMSVTINPTVSGSKLLITAGGGGKGAIDTNDESNSHNLESFLQLQVYRGSTALGQQTNIGAGGEGFYIAIVDTNNHGGNNVTYTVKAKMSQGYHLEPPSGRIRKGSSLMIQEII